MGSQDEEGNPKPYTIYFVLKAGLKFDEEVLKNLKNNDLSELGFKQFSLQSDEALMPCSHTTNDTCEDDNKAIYSGVEKGDFIRGIVTLEYSKLCWGCCLIRCKYIIKECCRRGFYYCW